MIDWTAIDSTLLANPHTRLRVRNRHGNPVAFFLIHYSGIEDTFPPDAGYTFDVIYLPIAIGDWWRNGDAQ